MANKTEQFDQYKIDRLKDYLVDMASKGHARDFEIYVDHFKVVDRTADPVFFDDYDRYVTDDTEKVRIIIYNGASNKNDQYLYTFQNNKNNNGLGEIESIIQDKLTARDKEHAMERLKSELEQTKEKLKESEEYADMLTQQLEDEKSRKLLKTTSFADFGAIILESLIRQNPQWLAKVPMVGNQLAGFIEQDTIEKQQQQQVAALPDTAVSFQRKDSSQVTVSPEQMQHLVLLKSMEESFDQQQLDTIMQILGRFAQEPTSLQAVADLLNIKP